MSAPIRRASEKVTQARMADIFRIYPRLAERRTQLAGTMSGGEQAMVSIGRGLMCAPKLLLIDEPSLGLSPRLVKENFDIIRQINERGITVLLVEQNVHQTLAISHYGFVLSKGRVATGGRLRNLPSAKRCAMLILDNVCTGNPDLQYWWWSDLTWLLDVKTGHLSERSAGYTWAMAGRVDRTGRALAE